MENCSRVLKEIFLNGQFIATLSVGGLDWHVVQTSYTVTRSDQCLTHTIRMERYSLRIAIQFQTCFQYRYISVIQKVHHSCFCQSSVVNGIQYHLKLTIELSKHLTLDWCEFMRKRSILWKEAPSVHMGPLHGTQDSKKRGGLGCIERFLCLRLIILRQ